MKSTDKDGNTIITLPVFNILITITKDGGGGSIMSDIKERAEDFHGELYNASIDGIESMILGHAIAGIDVTTPEYLEGIETAVQSCANNF